MEWMLFGLAFVMGGVASRLVFGGTKSNPIEDAIMRNLALGKRVVVSFNDDCLILEMKDGRIRATKGISTFYEEPYLVDPDNNTDNVLPLSPKDT